MPAPACRTHIAQANRVARNPGHAKMADVFYETSARLPSTLSSGGGGIRTRDLWVMSPTSCRCSTPRHECILDSRRGGARSGLASHGVAPAVLSGAALGHDRVRDGSGWSQNALGHGHRPASGIGLDNWAVRHSRPAPLPPGNGACSRTGWAMTRIHPRP